MQALDFCKRHSEKRKKTLSKPYDIQGAEDVILH